ncbi:response regulator [Nocardioides sp.]|uniref:ATP-binding response regulator n=1 Tax=Nocardioides sp. TaxID=35761 RepID=UPI00286C3E07|nr:response regulator [Nocardioides sp.]
MSALATTRPRRVVIIDDTPDLRELLKLALIRGGFEVVAEAGDGREGIEVVRTTRPDVILLDLAMPVMDGIEALPTIRRLCPSAKIVVLSGFGAQQMSARAVAAGADGYVQKGAPLTTILDYVRDIASGGTRKPARTLSVVPSSSRAVQAETLAERPTMSTKVTLADAAPDASSSVESRAHISAWEAMELAPYGIIELADEPLFRIMHANGMALRLLGDTTIGMPLGMAAAELSQLVSFHRLDADASFEVDVDGGRVRATLRRTGWSLLVYLDSGAEDVGLLRRAIATTAHEIRGPVAVICGIAETVGWDSAEIDDTQRDRLMGSVARQARILDSITADLLTAAQIQRGTLRIDMQVVDPRTIIEGAIADRYDVEVFVEDTRSVRADPLRLEQMLTNLLSNAHKYGAPPYSIHVRAEGALVCIDVVDHGDGVPEEFTDRLFQEFARANDAVASGTGLGLYVVKTLAHAQNGEVGHAAGVHDGSVFTVKLLAC